MHYTYLLRSHTHPERRYVGFTSDLRQRLADHNAGKCPHTASGIPWKLATYVAFDSREKALAFERYLKSGSGHAFARRHL
jgi:predicted GIY-YIG superfamily endonuclease